MKYYYYISIIILNIYITVSYAEDKYISDDMRNLYNKYSNYCDNKYELVLFKETILFAIDTKDYDMINITLYKVGFSRFHEVILLIDENIKNIDNEILKYIIINMIKNMRNIELIGRAENDERIKKIINKIENICRNNLNISISVIKNGIIDVDYCLKLLDDPVPH